MAQNEDSLNRTYILRTSKDIYYRFYISETRLMVEIYDGLVVTQCITEDILDFSVYMCDDDNIYIVYLTFKGQLRLCSYPGFERNTPLFCMNVNKNYVKSIKVIVMHSYVHIFYTEPNTQNNGCYCIYDYLYNNKSWTKVKICDNAEPLSDIFFKTAVSGSNIYLMFKSKGTYNVITFSSTNLQWNMLTDRLLIYNPSSISFMPDNKGDIFLAWCAANRTDVLSVSYYKFLDIEKGIPLKESFDAYTFNHIPYSSLAALGGKFYILAEADDLIYYAIYNDSSKCFGNLKKLCSKTNSMRYAAYYSNFPSYGVLRLENTIIELGRYPYPVLHIIPPNDFKLQEQISYRTTYKKINGNTINAIKNRIEYLKTLRLKYTKLKPQLQEKDRTIEKLQKLVYSLYTENKNLEMRIQELESSDETSIESLLNIFK